MTAPAQRFATPWSFGRALVIATLVAGSLDLGYALTVSALRGFSPVTVCQTIAAGLLGRDAAYAGGYGTAMLGLGLHFAMMALIAAVFLGASRLWPRLNARPWLSGPVYGALVFAVMNYAVVPLSALGHAFQRPALLFAGELFSHVVFVGWIIAACASRVRRV
jgi:hypothetical protein